MYFSMTHWMYLQSVGIHLFPEPPAGQTLFVCIQTALFLSTLSSLPFPTELNTPNPRPTHTHTHTFMVGTNSDSYKSQVEQDVLCLKFTSAHDFRLMGPSARSGFSFQRKRETAGLASYLPSQCVTLLTSRS